MPVIPGKKGFLYIAVLLLLLLPALPLLPASLSAAARSAGFELMDKSGLSITLSPVNPAVRELSADPSNKLVLKVSVRDSDGRPIQGAKVRMKITQGPGSLTPASPATDSEGNLLVQYAPPFLDGEAFGEGKPAVNITAGISGAGMVSEYSFTLTRKPVVFIPGYQAAPEIFSSMKEYLESRGFVTAGLSYDSEKGVAAGAAALDSFLDGFREDLLAKGIQADRVDIVAHSMGGLVARYYTCGAGYPSKNDVDKIIFVSVPQTGSPIATLGLEYYDDRGVHDLIPGSPLYTVAFPSMINGGLNGSIQVGSMLGQYDEVVTPESASLERWGIRTEMFDVGDSNFTVDSLLSGKLAEAPNHKVVLYNRTVFRRVEAMLGSMLPYPAEK